VKDNLTRALEEVFRRPVVKLQRRPLLNSSSFAIELLELTLEDHGVKTVIFKNLERGAVLEGARQVKPEFLYDPQREINVYGRLLPRLNLGAPGLFGVVNNWLFLESVNAPELYQIGELEAWMEAARWLAHLHVAGVSSPDLARSLVPQLLRHDRCWYEGWLRRARAFTGARLDPIEDICHWSIDTLLGSPQNVIHGEFYASNVLAQKRESGYRISPVDWEMAAIGPGILDVAALASGRWGREQRLAMLDAYCDALPDRVRPREPVVAFDSAQLQIALQWLGWSEHWQPWKDHAHDWLAEAFAAASALAGVAATALRRAG
jgi:hypothetical protein